MNTARLLVFAISGLLMVIILSSCQENHDFYVTTTGSDNNTCTSADKPCRHIQAAVDRALKQGDRIFIAAGTYNETVVISGKSLSISGEGPTNTIISGTGVCSPGLSNALINIYSSNMDQQSVVQINNLAARDCIRAAGKNRNMGGGFYINSAKVTLSDVLVTGNQADGGGGIYLGMYNSELIINYSTITNNTALGMGGGIASLGKMTINGGTTIAGNLALDSGGGIVMYYGQNTIMDTIIQDNRARNQGGGIKNNATLVLINSTLDGNITEIGSGGGIWNKGFMEIFNSTLSNNLAKVNGGGIFNRKSMNLENTTISGNMAINGGGVFNTTDEGILYLMNVTVADSGGTGIIIDDGEASIYDTLVAFNDPANCRVESTFAAAGNLSSDESCPGFEYKPDPMIGPLTNNGGVTATHALLPGSPAIDLAAMGNDSIMSDQRMTARPWDGNGDGTPLNDAGAYEYIGEAVIEPTEQFSYIPPTNLNCRTGPGLDWNTMSVVPAGTILPVEGKNQDGTWVAVVLPDGTRCWTFVQNEVTGIESLPVLPDPPKPFRPTETSLSPKNCERYLDEVSCENAGCDWDQPAAGLPGSCK